MRRGSRSGLPARTPPAFQFPRQTTHGTRTQVSIAAWVALAVSATARKQSLPLTVERKGQEDA